MEFYGSDLMNLIKLYDSLTGSYPSKLIIRPIDLLTLTSGGYRVGNITLFFGVELVASKIDKTYLM